MTPSAALPAWLERLSAAANGPDVAELVRFRVPAMPEGPTRAAAVLVLFGPSEPPRRRLRRATSSSSSEPPTCAPTPASRRSPAERWTPVTTGRWPPPCERRTRRPGSTRQGIDVFAVLPALPLPVSSFVVTPVLGWWREPSRVWAGDPAEVSAVHRVPIAELVDPANRLRMRYPSGFVGPAFEVAGMTVWGFTAGVLDRLFAVAGWERPWDASRLAEMPQDVRRDAPIVDEPAGGAA